MPFPSNPRPSIFAASPGDKKRSLILALGDTKNEFVPASGDKTGGIYPRSRV
jgi:hypothetical protein